MLVFFRVPLRWREMLKRTIAEIGEDNCLGLAAQLAFYFVLALFPALLFLVALVGYLPIEDTLTGMLAALGTVAPGEVLTLLRTQLEELARGSHGSLLTLGIGGAIWSSSAATGLWILSSFAFKFYVTNLANFNATYGAIGGVVVLLLWFYVSGLAILVGAELNGVIEQAWRMVPRERPNGRRR